MARIRKPFEGVINIVRFNWHFFVIAGVLSLIPVFTSLLWPIFPIWLCILLVCVIILPVLVSLLVSFYVYDLSSLYEFNWLNEDSSKNNNMFINIHAGFDEISEILTTKFPEATLRVFDFYDPEAHTEISIKRARNAYPSYPGTLSIQTSRLPVADNSANTILLMLAAHEIRNKDERHVFFSELHRCLSPDGTIWIVEHLRDWPNFYAYTLGFLHFYSLSSWLAVFRNARLKVAKKEKLTPFLTVFTLTKVGN